MSVMQTCGRVFLFLVMVAVVLVQATRNRRDEPQPPKPNVPVAPAFYAPSSDRSTLVAVDNPMQIEKAKTAATAINAFGLKLLAGVVAGQQHENVFLSPLSVFTALTMTENGAAGQTRAAMRHALSVPAAMSEDTLHEAASALLKELRSQKGIDLSIANALWSDMKLPLAPSFVQRCQHLYDADATTLDFNKPAAVDTINGWVKEKTRGKISSIVTPELVRASQAILTNAVYFRGTWLYQFSKSETQDAIFHLANGRQKKTPLMHRAVLPGAYRSGPDFEAAALPYGSSGMRLYAILPAPGKAPEEVLKKISVEKLRSPSQPNELDLKLPRFTLDFSAGLKGPLAQMGMDPAFHPGANFAPMGSPLFYIGEVLHKTRLEVDEEGTVAAAATGVAVFLSAFHQPKVQKKTLVFDRPFAVLLCDIQTGAVLFAGVIYDPQP